MDCISKYNSIYIHGNTNSGKTSGVIKYLEDNNFEYQYVSIQNIRNESQFFDLLKNQNIFNMMKMEKMSRVIVIDNIDSLQNSDKKILNVIIKHIKHENKTTRPINAPKYIFIGINIHDKKVAELDSLVEHVYHIEEQTFHTEVDKNIKQICKHLLTDKDVDYIHICEKTIVSLVYHENIILYTNEDLIYYQYFLDNFVNGDYYDRVSFQRQLWQFGEMTFFLKVINNYIKFHEKKWNNHKTGPDIIFTKILTKYSNEYTNLNFIIGMCNKFNCQKVELVNYLDDNKLMTNEKKRLEKLLC